MIIRLALLFSFVLTNSVAFADNRSDQMNPNNDSYWQSRGYDERPDDWDASTNERSRHGIDNRSNQLNPNNDSYWQSRGYDERPDDWDASTNERSQHEMDNRSDQLNPNNDIYWKSRDYDENQEDTLESYFPIFELVVKWIAIR